MHEINEVWFNIPSQLYFQVTTNQKDKLMRLAREVGEENPTLLIDLVKMIEGLDIEWLKLPPIMHDSFISFNKAYVIIMENVETTADGRSISLFDIAIMND